MCITKIICIFAVLPIRLFMITTIQFKTLDDLYRFYNQAIFGGTLSDCIVNMSRHGGAYGFFAANRWRGENEAKKIIHEISINPDFMNREDIEWHSTLVHEMCHLWQEDFGKSSRGGYHNRQWADKMVQVGLMPTDTGEPGGKQTGQYDTHYIIPAGRIEQVIKTLSREDLHNHRLRYKPTLAALSAKPVRIGSSGGDDGGDPEAGAGGDDESRSGLRKKFTCGCVCNLWGMSGLLLKCGLCGTDFIEQ